MGPILTGISGLSLLPEEVEYLQHPLVAGVILFTRNYHDNEQLIALTAQIKKISPMLLISVDHEGGRVQRFRDGFSAIPAMFEATSFQKKHNSPILADLGFTLAAELRAHGVDFSFTPVLDLNGISQVITTRAFASSPIEVIDAAKHFIGGLHSAGVKNVVKHFPGHGSVGPDSHIAMPVDERSKAEIFNSDMSVFKALVDSGCADGVMPAHVIYPDCDPKPACFSDYWLKQVLRNKLGFKGPVFSDDMGMQGAVQMGDYVTRTQSALDAGCDLALLCNEPHGLYEVLDGLEINLYQNHGQRGLAYLQKKNVTMMELKTDHRWLAAQSVIAKMEDYRAN
ncbi:beta-N-acetylhexosaminidase [Pseudoalteromonas tunicata]|uniref:beta-N-acetylhexosaminidase n=1 Tax=Pseudoalteromonas tunicata TaxID=314281 RepID=UPI00273F1224|nr:beta-N-acetylhexosaminidase [Pseudoalteromonas tunicata]MDP4982288.1 beta-N-acetylhexosaminidase [Pseudoalteromonas tunicata]